MTKLSEKGFGLVEGLLILAVVIGLGFGGYYVYSQNNTNDETTNVEETMSPDEVAEETILVESVYISDDGVNTFTLTHLADWKVDSYEGAVDWTDPEKWPYLAITSSNGNSIKFLEGGGLGGMCEPDTNPYTLTHRIETQNSNVVISEYSADNPAHSIVDQLVIEEWQDWTEPAHMTLSEGESSLNTCNIYILPSLRGVSVAIASDGTTNEYGAATYVDVADDLQFIKMLESLNVTP